MLIALSALSAPPLRILAKESFRMTRASYRRILTTGTRESVATVTVAIKVAKVRAADQAVVLMRTMAAMIVVMVPCPPIRHSRTRVLLVVSLCLRQVISPSDKLSHSCQWPLLHLRVPGACDSIDAKSEREGALVESVGTGPQAATLKAFIVGTGACFCPREMTLEALCVSRVSVAPILPCRRHCSPCIPRTETSSCPYEGQQKGVPASMIAVLHSRDG